MSDDISDPREEYLRTTNSIETLSRLAQLTSEAKRRRYLQDEIDRLTVYREQLAESFELDIEEIEQQKAQAGDPSQGEEAADQYPILYSIRNRYTVRAGERELKDPEIRNVIIYVRFFEEEYLPVLDKKKINLDRVSILEMESFFNLFNGLQRRLEIFTSETGVVYEQRGLKALQKIKAKQVLLVEVYKFFKRIRGFCEELLTDIDGPQTLCFNGDTPMWFASYESDLTLVGSTVRETLEKIAAFCHEVIEYLDIPSFKQ